MDGRATVAILVAEGEPLGFASVGAALSHARALQPGSRVGVATGDEPEARAVADRLRTGAEPGQVLVSDPARWAERDGHAFREIGALEPGAGGGPVHAWEFLWAEPAPRTRVRLCGELALEIDGERRVPPGGQAASLLGFLLASPERAADRAELIEVLWPHRAPRDPHTALRPILSRLRRALGPAALEGRERLRLRLPEPVWTDIDEATDALVAARAAAKAERWERDARARERGARPAAARLPPRYRRRLGARPAAGARRARARGARVDRARLPRSRGRRARRRAACRSRARGPLAVP